MTREHSFPDIPGKKYEKINKQRRELVLERAKFENRIAGILMIFYFKK